MFDFDALTRAIVGKTVLCVGDVMLDEFVYGEVSRISPEAPAPVMAVQRNELMVGGAGNVARNVAALGAKCLFVGVIGEDEAGRTLENAFAKEERISAYLICDKARPTTRKVRFVSEHFSTHMLRADWEEVAELLDDAEQALLDVALPLIPQADVVLLSDYAKGVLTTRVIQAMLRRRSRLVKTGLRS
jgi:D-beta-D-heptose 7-phosphate kinase/D-beta-D-heptose 1-phosphate adenosyltransferase